LSERSWKRLAHESREGQSTRARDRPRLAEFHSSKLSPVARTSRPGRLLGLHLRQLHPHASLRTSWHERYRNKDSRSLASTRRSLPSPSMNRTWSAGFANSIDLPYRHRQQPRNWKAFANRFWPTKYLPIKTDTCATVTRRRQIRRVRAGDSGVAPRN
jgi:hypothetical protein